MKKTAWIPLTLALLLALSACSGNTSGTASPSAPDDSAGVAEPSDTAVTPNAPAEETPEAPPEEEAPETYAVGDTVSTDLAEFTLDDAQLAIALDNTLGENYCLPKAYDAEADAQNPFVAPTGHTYAAFTYTLTNLGRTSYSGELPFVTAAYGDAVSDRQVDSVEYRADDQTWEPTGNDPNTTVFTWNFVLEVGETRSFRSSIDLPAEAASLSDPFTLTVELPASDGTTASFVYEINPAA